MRNLYKGFKKIAEDEKSAKLLHDDGHELKISKMGLNKDLKKGLSDLPLYQAEPEEMIQPTDEAQPDTLEMMREASFPTSSKISIPLPAQVNKAVKNPNQPMMTANPINPQVSAQDFSQLPGYTQQTQALSDIANAKKQEAEAEAQAQANFTYQQTKNLKRYQDSANEIKNHIDGVTQDYMNGHIDPNDYWAHKGTGERIGTAIGLLLGGMGAGVLRQENPVLKQMNLEIERNLDAQRANLGKQHNVLSALTQQYGNQLTAEHVFRAANASVLAGQIAQAASKSNAAQALPAAQMAIGQLQQQYMPSYNAAVALHAAQNATQGMQGAQMDPASLVRYLVPEGQQKDAFKEIGDAQNASQNEKTIFEQFDQAAKDVRFLTGGKPLYSTFVTPPSIKALHTLGLPLLHDKEGRINEEAIKRFDQVLPQMGDSDETVAIKRQTLNDFIQSKKAAPIAKGYGIDLSKFQSTTPNIKQAEIKTMNGVPYQRVAGGWKRVQ